MTQPAEGREEAHTHCWHRGRLSLTMASNPPQHQETCCHCGATIAVRDELPPIPAGHGPHHPNAKPPQYTYLNFKSTP